MENAAKALLIAAAVLMILILLATVVIFWDQLSGYFTERHEATMLEQLVEFNNKFQNYNGKTIRGNELVSIMNRVIDYNNYQSDMIGYERIQLEIDLLGHKDEFTYGGETGGERLIKNDPISNEDDDEEIKTISETSSRLSSDLGFSDTQLQKLSSRIADIVDEDGAADKEAYKIFRAQKLTQILGREYDEGDNVSDIITATYQYYQYTQFKRAMFECTGVFYDEDTGRVNGMTFQVVLEDNKVKFD